MKFKKIAIETTYLVMQQPVAEAAITNLAEITATTFVVEATEMNLAFYRYLYAQVGAPLGWAGRLLLKDVDLLEIISQPTTKIFVLYHQGVPAGYTEFLIHNDDSIELKYFGLIPHFQGKGLGKLLLYWSVNKAWSFNPTKIWLHTCSFDSPVAMALYAKAGFTIQSTQVDYEPYEIEFLRSQQFDDATLAQLPNWE